VRGGELVLCGGEVVLQSDDPGSGVEGQAFVEQARILVASSSWRRE
jgi:hypothetical protein